MRNKTALLQVSLFLLNWVTSACPGILPPGTLMATGLHHGRYCGSVGCGRRMPPMPLNGMPGHGMCCATCRTGTHTRQCDRAFRRFNRLIVSECRTEGCNLQVQEGHTTYCSTCWLSGGGQHKRRCSRRQGLLTARLHARAQFPPAGANTAAAAHQGRVVGGNGRGAMTFSRAMQGQALGEASASSSSRQPFTALFEVLSSGEEDQEQPTSHAFAQEGETQAMPAVSDRLTGTNWDRCG